MNESRDDKLLEDAAKLSTSMSPSRDLWPGIEAEIAAPGRSLWSPRFAQAAAVVLLMAGSSAITWLAMQDEQEVQLAVQPDYVFDQAAFGSNYSLGPGFIDARGGLAAKLDAQLEKLPPEDRADVEKSLELIRSAIDEINAELARDPDNARLQALLLKTYREELMLMRRVGDLAQTVTSRNDI